MSFTLKAAGKSTISTEPGASACLRFEERPPTPEKDKRWRTVQEPGARIRHPGVRADSVDEKAVYGDYAPKVDSVSGVLKANDKKPLDAYLVSKGEEIYRSTKREPLGKSMSRGVDVSRLTSNPDFAFGIGSATSEAAKNLLFPEDVPVDAAKQELYKKSHSAYEPGEQRSRGYQWEAIGVDPSAHRFGGVAKDKTTRGVAMALNPQEDKAAPSGVVVSLAVAQQRMYATDQLGKVKGVGRLPDTVPESFGATKRRPGDDVTAAAVLRGDYSFQEQLPDKDLGKSTRPGFRNVTKDPSRTFGVPTIRTDVPERTHTSIADSVNYGKGPQASDLINPSRFADMGVDHTDFVEPRGQEEIRDLFASIGHSFDDATFDAIWRRAASAYDLNRNGEVSVEEFRMAMNEYEDTIAEGGYPEWA